MTITKELLNGKTPKQRAEIYNEKADECKANGNKKMEKFWRGNARLVIAQNQDTEDDEQC